MWRCRRRRCGGGGGGRGGRGHEDSGRASERENSVHCHSARVMVHIAASQLGTFIVKHINDNVKRKYLGFIV